MLKEENIIYRSMKFKEERKLRREIKRGEVMFIEKNI